MQITIGVQAGVFVTDEGTASDKTMRIVNAWGEYATVMLEQFEITCNEPEYTDHVDDTALVRLWCSGTLAQLDAAREQLLRFSDAASLLCSVSGASNAQQYALNQYAKSQGNDKMDGPDGCLYASDSKAFNDLLYVLQQIQD